jgi:Uma2 family endonuclease
MSSLHAHPELDSFDDSPEGKVRPSLRMSEEEFVAWCDEDTRAEWVDGEVVFMAPDSGEHDDLGWWLKTLLRMFVAQRDLGLVRGPNFMARLSEQRRRRVPDVLFIARERAHLLRPAHLEGAPDLCIEVVSSDSQSRDRREKYLDYEKAGVREYWIVDPLSRTLEGYSLQPGSGFQRLVAEEDERLLSRLLPGFYLRQSWLFGQTLPNFISVLQEMGVDPDPNRPA